jgi:hypothetical protein
MKIRLTILAAIFVIATFPPTSADSAVCSKQPITQQVVSPLEARIDSFLQESGYQYGKVKSNSWYISTTGKELSKIRILVGASGSSLAVAAVVVSKRNVPTSAEAMTQMLKLSYDFNYVRVCIDSDGDLTVLSQLREPWIDAAEFKRTVDIVTAAADRAYGEIRPFLATP